MFLTILMGVIALTGVIALLVLLVMFAESKLVTKGEVPLVINGDSTKSPPVPIVFSHPSRSSRLSALLLLRGGIFLFPLSGQSGRNRV